MIISRRSLIGSSSALLLSPVARAVAQPTHSRSGRVYEGSTPLAFDLSDLPVYAPEQRVSGKIRCVGTPFRGAVEGWQRAFAVHQPGVSFENNLPSSDVAMPGLIMGLCDIAPSGREACLEEVLGFSETYFYNPTSIAVASGAAYTPGGASWSPVILVSADNPLARLTLAQLDGIFGEARSGGYGQNSVEWNVASARGPERNIRTWGQLGLSGAWAGKPIQTYGYAPTGMRSFFELVVFGGGKKWNPNYREYVDTGTKMVPEGVPIGSHDMLLQLAKDPYGIAWSGNGHAAKVPGLKAIPLARTAAGPYAEPTAANMQSRRYPLTRSVFMHINRKPGTPLDPAVREYLRFVLSREAQEMLSKAGNQLPLNRETVLQERRKLV